MLNSKNTEFNVTISSDFSSFFIYLLLKFKNLGISQQANHLLGISSNNISQTIIMISEYPKTSVFQELKGTRDSILFITIVDNILTLIRINLNQILSIILNL